MSRLLSSCGSLVALLALALPASAADFLGKSAREWGAELSSPKAEARRAASFALGKIGADAESEMDKLIGLLQRETDAGVKEAVAAAIGDVTRALEGRSKGYWAASSPVLEKALTDASPRVKRSAAYALGTFGAEAASAMPALKTALRDGAPMVRQNAAWALGNIGRKNKEGKSAADEDTVTMLCARLKDDDALVRRDAATALGEIGLPTAASAWQPLLDLVQSEAAKGDAADDVLLRTALAKVVVLIDNKNKEVRDSVNMFMLPTNPESIRNGGQRILENLGAVGLPDAAKKRSDWIDRFHKTIKSEGGRLTEATILEYYGEMERLAKAENAALAAKLDPINRLLNHEDEETSRLSAFVLARIGGPLAARAVPVLRKALADPDPAIPEQAATFLGELGPDAALAVDDLAAAVQVGKPESLRSKAAVALFNIGPPSARASSTILAALLAPPSPDAGEHMVRRYLTEVFLRMNYPNNKSAIPDLLDLLAKDNDFNVRLACAWVFLNTTPEDFPAFRSRSGPSAEQVLTDALSDPKLAGEGKVIKTECARALANNLGEKTPEKAIEVLLEALADDKRSIYIGTGGNIGKLGSEGTSGGANVNTQKGGDPRYLAADALGKIGRTAKRKDVLDALRLATKDTKDTTGRLQKAATEALEAIEK